MRVASEYGIGMGGGMDATIHNPVDPSRKHYDAGIFPEANDDQGLLSPVANLDKYLPDPNSKGSKENKD